MLSFNCNILYLCLSCEYCAIYQQLILFLIMTTSATTPYLKRTHRFLSDQLKAEEISLIEATPEEAEAAKSRLDEVRKKRRDRHDSKKASTN